MVDCRVPTALIARTRERARSWKRRGARRKARIHGIVSHSRPQGLTRPGMHSSFLCPLDNPSSSLFLFLLPSLTPRPPPSSPSLSFAFIHLSPSIFSPRPSSAMRGDGGRKHSQSFSPFCDSISADIAPVSLDSSIRSDEDAADEGNIFIRVVKKETERRNRERGARGSRRKKGGNGMVRGDEKARKREGRGGPCSEVYIKPLHGMAN